MEKANKEYYDIGKPHPGENILEDFPQTMLEESEFIFIISKIDETYLRCYRIYHNFEYVLDSEGNDDDGLQQRHPDYVNFCKKRIETRDPDVDIELDRCY